MSGPRLLDLFCKAGGAAMGYARAGFEVVGVDIEPQPHYPFEFHQADALTFPLDGFDAYHASPPCKGNTALAVIWKRDHPDLLTPTRARLSTETAAPFVIENVPGAPMYDYVTLCGTQFGLMTDDAEMWRHRWFEAHRFPWPTLMAPCAHRQRPRQVGVYGGGSTRPTPSRRGGWSAAAPLARALMGIDWMNRDELAQAIPPAYTEWIGAQLLAHLAASDAA